MDLDQFDTAKDEGSTLFVKHPGTGLPLLSKDSKPVTIQLLSKDHPEVRHYQRQLMIEAAKNGAMSVAEVEKQAIEIVVRATLGWEGIGMGQDSTDFSVEAARQAYTKFNWLRIQVDNFVSDLGNFITAPSVT